MFYINERGYQLLFVLPKENEAKAQEYLIKHRYDTPFEQMGVLTKTYHANCFDLSPRGRYSSNLNIFESRGYLYVFENEFDKQKAYVYVQEHRDDDADNVAASIKEMFICNALKLGPLTDITGDIA